MRLLGSIIATSVLVACATASKAERPISSDNYVHSQTQGYILAWIGPLKGRKDFRDLLEFLRLDPATGETIVRRDPYLLTTNARRQKDAAAVYQQATPWAIDGDRGLFLIPVNPGRWVVGGVNLTALSLGSHGFQVEPGKISYIGTVLIGKEDGTSDVPEIKAAEQLPGGVQAAGSNVPDTIVLRPPNLGDLPSDFPREHLYIPEIERDVRFNNYQSALVSRAADLGLMGHELPVARAESYTVVTSAGN